MRGGEQIGYQTHCAPEDNVPVSAALPCCPAVLPAPRSRKRPTGADHRPEQRGNGLPGQGSAGVSPIQ